MVDLSHADGLQMARVKLLLVCDCIRSPEKAMTVPHSKASLLLRQGVPDLPGLHICSYTSSRLDAAVNKALA